MTQSSTGDEFIHSFAIVTECLKHFYKIPSRSETLRRSGDMFHINLQDYNEILNFMLKARHSLDKSSSSLFCFVLFSTTNLEIALTSRTEENILVQETDCSLALTYSYHLNVSYKIYRENKTSLYKMYYNYHFTI